MCNNFLKNNNKQPIYLIEKIRKELCLKMNLKKKYPQIEIFTI